MQSTWFWNFVAWLNPLRDLAWEQATADAYPGRASLGWDAALRWEDAADQDLILYAALITAAHY
jgi:hypothetical protein